MNIFRKIEAWARAMNIKEIHRKRIIRENIEAWNRHNRAFIKRENAWEWKRIKSGYYTKRVSSSPGGPDEWD